VLLFTDGWSGNDEAFKERKSGGGLSNREQEGKKEES